MEDEVCIRKAVPEAVGVSNVARKKAYAWRKRCFRLTNIEEEHGISYICQKTPQPALLQHARIFRKGKTALKSPTRIKIMSFETKAREECTMWPGESDQFRA